MELLFFITLLLLSISVVPQVNAIFSLAEAEAFSLRAVNGLMKNGERSQVFGINRYRGGSVENNNDEEDDDNNNMLYKNEEEVYYRDSEIPPIPSISYAEDNNDFNSQAQAQGQGQAVSNVLFILMDSFSPYHGQYLSNLARERYGVHIVNVLSGYIVNGLVLSRKFVQEDVGENEEDDESEGKNDNIMNLTIPIQMRAPYKGKETTEWFAKLCKEFQGGVKLDIAGIYCESDSGLLSAERLGKELNIVQHNGINHARRDKFLMNQAVSSYSKTREGRGDNNEKKMRTVQQKRCVTLDDALTFASEKLGVIGETDDEGKKKKKKYCIVKPFRGVASENVFLCDSLEKVQKAFQEIDQNPLFGEGPPEEKEEKEKEKEKDNDVKSTEKLAKVLIQEFAEGEEYAIDIVSKNGEHKIAALWKYDKRPVGEHAFVYHATQLCQDIYYPPPTDDDNKLFNDVVDLEKLGVMEYAMDSLNALGVKWGLSHVEVKINVKPEKLYVTMKDYYEDCTLIEVNCRQHNTDFAPLTNFCIGYDAFEMLLAAYFDDYKHLHKNNNGSNSNADESESDCDGDGDVVTKEEQQQLQQPLRWDDIPQLPFNPTTFGTRAAIVHLVCHVEGTLKQLNHIEELEQMDSVQRYEIFQPYRTIGYDIEKTKDIRTDAGWVILLSDDKDQFQRDYDRIMELMKTMFVV